MTTRTPMTIRRGDTVKLMVGNDHGKSGKVTQVLPAERRVVIEGVNARKKNIRVQKSAQGQKGEIVTFNAPVPVSNVVLMCPKCSKPTRVGFSIIDGKKHRQCRKCKQVIDA